VIFRRLADLVLVLHAAFALFAMAGGLLVLRRPWVAWLHVPAATWAALVEFAGWICPLTPLENALRIRGGGVGYSGDFLGHLVSSVLYPASLTRGIQAGLGALVLAVNGAVYWRMAARRRVGHGQPDRGALDEGRR
jgi:uncharacterized protein DUF2784